MWNYPCVSWDLQDKGNPRLKNLLGFEIHWSLPCCLGFLLLPRVLNIVEGPMVKVVHIFQSTMYDSSHFVLEDYPTGMNLPENRYNSRVKFHCFRTWHKIWYTRSVGKDLCCMNLLNEFCIITFSFFEMMSKVFFSLPSLSCPFIYMYTSKPSISCPFIYMYKIQSSKMLHL